MSYAFCAYHLCKNTLAWLYIFSLVWFRVFSIETNQGTKPMFNFSQKKIGGIRFIKLGRFCFSFCITSQYKALI